MTELNEGAIHLVARLFDYVQLIEEFLGEPLDRMRLPIMERAVTIAETLAKREDSPQNERLAHEICGFMNPMGHPPAQFWATDLGADIAWHIGYPHERVPMWAAAAVLRVNRVTAWRLAKQGPLDAARLRVLTRSR